MQELSLTVAFLGGVLTLLPACGPALLPAFFGYTFASRQKLVLATIFFGLGFTAIFLPFSLGVRFFVDILLTSHTTLFTVVGWLLIIFGLLSLFNWGLAFFVNSPKKISQPWQTFFLGITFGLTSSTCIAPIYGAIITLAGTSPGYWQAVFLVLAFVLGMIVPLLVLAYLFERYGFVRLGFLQKPVIEFTFLGKPISIFLGNLLSGLIFISLGILFLNSSGSAPLLSSAQSLGLVNLFSNLNDYLINFNSRYPYLDFLMFVAILVVLAGFLLKKR